MLHSEAAQLFQVGYVGRCRPAARGVTGLS